MLPGPGPGVTTPRRFNTGSWVPEYLQRMIHYPQMDMEYTFWQMFYLCVQPSRVYRTTQYHKQTKNQWARDDPAFVALLVFFLSIASLSYAVAFHVGGILNIIKLMFWSVFIDFISIGVLVATLGWWVSNKYLRVRGGIHTHSVDQTVEWLYAFDIHCNSFFPLFLILYVAQFFCVPFLLSTKLIATFFANTMYLVAFVYYWHVTFRGYSALPFLHNTVYFLYPIGLLFIGYIISLVFNFNATVFIMNTYFFTLPKTG